MKFPSIFTPLNVASAALRGRVCPGPGVQAKRGSVEEVTCCSGVLQELCLYTLGNLVVESEAVRKQLLPQGIIPVLASCIQVGEIAQLASPAPERAFSDALQALAEGTEVPATFPLWA